MHYEKCGKELDEGDKFCTNCGVQHDRDVNASLNILNIGLAQLA